MIIINTTFVMDKCTEHKFIAFIQDEYLPMIADTGLLQNPSLRRIITSNQDDESVNIALHLEAVDMETLNHYLDRFGEVQANLVAQRFGSLVLGFTTLMEEL